MRNVENLTVAVALDRSGGVPMHEQLAEQLAAGIESGVLTRGVRMPSTRTLAEQLGVSRGVAVAAYEVLFARGHIEGRHGSGTYVSEQPVSMLDRRPVSVVESRARLLDLTPGQPCTEGFPLAAWRAAWRRASFHPPPVTGLPQGGLAPLRRAVADHLRRTRGVVMRQHEVVVTTGVAHGLRIVCEAVNRKGNLIAVEDPLAPPLRRVLGDGVAVPVPVDRDGVQVEAIPASCRFAVVHPDGHGPLGYMLSAARRRQLATWALARGGGVVEIARDHVMRPVAAPLPRLLDLAEHRTVIIGELGSIITPALRLGYAVLSSPLLRQVLERDDPEQQPSYVTQLAVTTLLTEGVVIRRMRQLSRTYEHKGSLVRAALAPLGLPVVGSATDAEAVVYLPQRHEASHLSDVLRGRGLVVPTLASFYSSGKPARNGLVLGYGHLPEPALRRALAVFVDVLDMHATVARQCHSA